MGFILVLFIDSMNRMNKITQEIYGAREHGSDHTQSGVPPPPPAQHGLVGGESRSEIQSRRFYAQRNSYLCGFTLFLTYVLNRTYSLVFELLAIKEQIQLKNKDAGLEKLDAGSDNEYASLKAELKESEEKIAALKKQGGSLSKDYDSLDASSTTKRRA
ncbi:unnamed protein product [Ambrosiozyma monospora]|uniref:Unnamed protein product n=1 Tax=Ambrosiozyma monospora TaxID=43982 RepID=A0ACB5TYE5_AMBMO|nr:unnamed protein product [Ambrosiozyma monospora]